MIGRRAAAALCGVAAAGALWALQPGRPPADPAPLRRLTFGSTAADRERFAKIGLEAWLGEQLSPPTDLESELKPVLAGFDFFGKSPSQLYRHLYAVTEPPSNCSPSNLARDIEIPVILDQMVPQRVMAAVMTRWQLREVMTDFWFNHFYVQFEKDEACSFGLPAYERDVLRRHALGRFRDLLGGVARSTPMLAYLDNTRSDAKEPNENFGRELLELHTVGIGAGYTQEDVVDAARCFTGWTSVDERGIGQEGEKAVTIFDFRFDPLKHDPGPKTVMGLQIPAGGGIEDGERVLDMLARHPSTARHLSRKLATRLVADSPPEALVEAGAQAFLRSDGDIAALVEALVTAPGFPAQGTKYKTPLEFTASAFLVCPPPAEFWDAMRQAHREEFFSPVSRDIERPPLVDQAVEVLLAFDDLGTPYGYDQPSGWPDREDTWNSPTGLQNRLRLARVIADLHLRRNPDLQGVDAVVEQVLGGQASAETRAVLAEAAAHGPADAVAAALMSPEFQYR